MAIDIAARLKGSLAQAVVKAAFSHFRYRVVPFGMEETVREVASLDEDAYDKLELPPTLRQTPDFIVASLDMSRAHLVEVKFRKNWSDKNRKLLFNTLRSQTLIWGGKLIVVFVFRDFFGKGTCLKCLSLRVDVEGKRYLEVVSPSKVIKNYNDITETDFYDLSAFFPMVETDSPEFKSALASLVSAEEVLSKNVQREKQPVAKEVAPPVDDTPQPPPEVAVPHTPATAARTRSGRPVPSFSKPRFKSAPASSMAAQEARSNNVQQQGQLVPEKVAPPVVDTKQPSSLVAVPQNPLLVARPRFGRTVPSFLKTEFKIAPASPVAALEVLSNNVQQQDQPALEEVAPPVVTEPQSSPLVVGTRFGRPVPSAPKPALGPTETPHRS